MAIEYIENQPWIFQERNETQECKKDEDVCNLIADGDGIFWQVIATPCEGAVLCDPDFGSALGNLVTNGDFAGSAAGWTLGATWTYADEHVTTDDTVSSALSQTIASGLNEDECYVLAFTISNYVSGQLNPVLGGTGGTVVSGNGTHRQVIVAGATDVLQLFSLGNPNEFSLDDVQLYSLGVCWCPDNGNLYSVSDPTGLLCHVPGVETTITQVGVTPPIVTGNRYRVRVTISDSSAGSVSFIVGAAATTTDFEGNGTHTDYVTADGNNNFEIVMSSDFDGCITDVLVAEMPSSINMGVVDLDGNLMQDLTAYVSSDDDRYTLAVNTDDFTFDYGCYKLFHLDPCDGDADPITSNCFNYRATHPGTRLIKALDRNETDPAVRYSYGFKWNGVTFYLQQRVECHFRKPGRETASNTDRFSTGRHFRSYAEKSKKWELAIIGLDETQHDCMDTMWGCALVDIDGTYYFAEYEEYRPDWDEAGYNVRADIAIEVSRRDDVIFSDNCNR